LKKIIAVTGTHGTGKTTLTFCLAMHYKQKGFNVKVIQEVARSCPFPLNDKMTPETALWIYYEHSKKELEALKDHDVVICDRTSFDSFAYAKSLNLKIPYSILQSSRKHLKTFYDRIFFVRPDLPLLNDGVRSTDTEFQNIVDEIFLDGLKRVDCIEVMSSNIFKKDFPWAHYCS